MELFNDIEVKQSALTGIAATMLILFVMPVIFSAIWKKRCGKSSSLKFLFIGAAGFLVSVRVLELGLHMIFIVGDNSASRFINGSTPAYVIYGILTAGVFEEVGRYIIIRFIMRKNITRENAVMYGIGHGGVEVWAITLLSLASTFAIAFTLKTQGTEALMKLLGFSDGIPANLLDSVTAAVSAAATYNALSGFTAVFERIVCMFAHIGLTVIVAYGVEKSKIKYLFFAVISHMIFDIFPALYQRGEAEILAMEIWLAVCTALLTAWSVRLYKNMKRES